MSTTTPPPSFDPVDPSTLEPLGQRRPPKSAGGKPDNYLVWAILATLCCCLPTGIVAIVYAAQVDSRWHGGDYVGAQESSDKAKLWSWISLGLGVLSLGAYSLMVAAGMAGF